MTLANNIVAKAADRQTTNIAPHHRDRVARFVRSQQGARALIHVAVVGSHGCGYSSPHCPLELKGIHVEPTENLVGLDVPPRTCNWVGEFEGLRIDYSTTEVGNALRSLLKGDGPTLERLFAPVQAVRREADLNELRDIAQQGLTQRVFSYYRNFAKGVLHRASDTTLLPTTSHMLSAYRAALTGIHILRKHEVVMDLTALATRYGMPEIGELVERNRQAHHATVEDRSRWAKLLVKLHAMLEESLDITELPSLPPDPRPAQEFLLDLRRRFFDAVTV